MLDAARFSGIVTLGDEVTTRKASALLTEMAAHRPRLGGIDLRHPCGGSVPSSISTSTRLILNFPRLLQRSGPGCRCLRRRCPRERPHRADDRPAAGMRSDGVPRRTHAGQRSTCRQRAMTLLHVQIEAHVPIAAGFLTLDRVEANSTPSVLRAWTPVVEAASLADWSFGHEGPYSEIRQGRSAHPLRV